MFLKNTLVVSFATFLSRVFGYIRDVILASFLGAGIMNDIFIIAFRIPNFFRAIFGEGAFSVSFIPIYSGILEERGKNPAQKFASYVQTLLLCSVILFAILAFIFMPEIVELVAPGVMKRAHSELATSLSRITIIYLVLISMVAFYGGILNSIGKYFAFAAAPIILNLVLIISALLGDNQLEKLYCLSYGIVIAGLLELMWVLWFLYRYGYLVKINKFKITEEIKVLFKRIIPGLMGSGLAQINILIDTVIASLIPGAISYLYYADRINQLPMALFGTAMGTVILPILTKAFKRGDTQAGIKLHNQAINLLLLISIPSMFAFCVLAHEIISTLFQRGEFTEEISIKTAKALIVFSLGLPAFSMIKIFLNNFYASGDTKTPVKISLVCIALNAFLSLVLLQYLSYVGIALASSIAAWVNIFTSWRILERRGRFKLESLYTKKIIKYIFSSTIMAVAIISFKPLLNHLEQALSLIILIFIGSGVYISLILLTKATSISEIKLLFNQKT